MINLRGQYLRVLNGALEEWGPGTGHGQDLPLGDLHHPFTVVLSFRQDPVSWEVGQDWDVLRQQRRLLEVDGAEVVVNVGWNVVFIVNSCGSNVES